MEADLIEPESHANVQESAEAGEGLGDIYDEDSLSNESPAALLKELQD